MGNRLVLTLLTAPALLVGACNLPSPGIPFLSTETTRRMALEVISIQSLLLVGPQLVGLPAATVLVFAAAYISFMPEEVRA